MDAWSDDLVTKLQAGLVDATVSLLSDRVPAREAVAGIIPFSGEITRPDAQILPAVLSVVRNAFVIGLASGFAHLPPPGKAAAPGEGGGASGQERA
jgi:hypothetical protein